MYVKVEPSGCCERKGLVQVRFAMYLEPNDYGYEKHHIQVPIMPPEGYQGEVDEEGLIVNLDDHSSWIESLPQKWVNNPFHNHFIYVEPETTDEEIMDIGRAFLEDAYIKWACEEKVKPKNPPVEFHLTPNRDRLGAIEAEVTHLRETTLKRRL